jgi:hypothetical protein
VTKDGHQHYLGALIHANQQLPGCDPSRRPSPRCSRLNLLRRLEEHLHPMQGADAWNAIVRVK